MRAKPNAKMLPHEKDGAKASDRLHPIPQNRGRIQAQSLPAEVEIGKPGKRFNDEQERHHHPESGPAQPTLPRPQRSEDWTRKAAEEVVVPTVGKHSGDGDVKDDGLPHVKRNERKFRQEQPQEGTTEDAPSRREDRRPEGQEQPRGAHIAEHTPNVSR